MCFWPNSDSPQYYKIRSNASFHPSPNTYSNKLPRSDQNGPTPYSSYRYSNNKSNQPDRTRKKTLVFRSNTPEFPSPTGTALNGITSNRTAFLCRLVSSCRIVSSRLSSPRSWALQPFCLSRASLSLRKTSFRSLEWCSAARCGSSSRRGPRLLLRVGRRVVILRDGDAGRDGQCSRRGPGRRL